MEEVEPYPTIPWLLMEDNKGCSSLEESALKISCKGGRPDCTLVPIGCGGTGATCTDCGISYVFRALPLGEGVVLEPPLRPDRGGRDEGGTGLLL